MQVSFVMLIFYCFWSKFGEQKSLRGANCLRGLPLRPPPPVEESQVILNWASDEGRNNLNLVTCSSWRECKCFGKIISMLSKNDT